MALPSTQLNQQREVPNCGQALKLSWRYWTALSLTTKRAGNEAASS